MTGIIHPSGLKQEDFPNSNGEWLVYQALSRIIMDREWVVLYDVWQERHVSQSHGQHDFIVMIPEKGIIVIEVKGSVIRIGNGGKMESLNRGRSEWVDIGSPFAQAKDNSYSLINESLCCVPPGFDEIPEARRSRNGKPRTRCRQP